MIHGIKARIKNQDLHTLSSAAPLEWLRDNKQDTISHSLSVLFRKIHSITVCLCCIARYILSQSVCAVKQDSFSHNLFVLYRKIHYHTVCLCCIARYILTQSICAV